MTKHKHISLFHYIILNNGQCTQFPARLGKYYTAHTQIYIYIYTYIYVLSNYCQTISCYTSAFLTNRYIRRHKTTKSIGDYYIITHFISAAIGQEVFSPPHDHPYYWPVHFESQVHAIDQFISDLKSQQGVSSKIRKISEKFKNFVINLTCDTPSNSSNYLWQIWK